MTLSSDWVANAKKEQSVFTENKHIERIDGTNTDIKNKEGCKDGWNQN